MESYEKRSNIWIEGMREGKYGHLRFFFFIFFIHFDIFLCYLTCRHAQTHIQYIHIHAQYKILHKFLQNILQFHLQN